MKALAHRLLAAEVFFEGATGLLLLAIPERLVAWLFGDPAALDATLARLAGAGLVLLAAGCWLLRGQNGGRRALGIFLAYNVLATALLLVVGLATAYVGVLLWPAVAAHIVLTGLVAATLSRRA